MEKEESVSQTVVIAKTKKKTQTYLKYLKRNI